MISSMKCPDGYEIVPKDYASVFCSSPGMFPGSSGKVRIDSATNATIRSSYSGSDPRIHDKTGVRVECVRCPAGVCSVEGGEERLCRDLIRSGRRTRRCAEGGIGIGGKAATRQAGHLKGCDVKPRW